MKNAILVFFVGLFAGFFILYRWDSERVEKANQARDEITAAYNALAVSSEKQNQAIEQMQKDQQDRQKQVEIAVSKANESAVKSFTKANQIMQAKAPAGQDECKAASLAFDNELQRERIK